MRIPASNLHLTAANGASVSRTSQQFGQVELKADGQVEDGFKSLPGAENPQWVDLRDQGVRNFFQAAGSELIGSSKISAELAQGGLTAGLEIKRSISDDVTNRLNQQLGGIPASTWVNVDDSGKVSRAQMRVKDNFSQQITVSQTPEGLVGRIESYRNSGSTHTITIPYSADGTPQFDKLSEKMDVNAPWIARPNTGGDNITEISDPRMERLAEAAELGMLVSPSELGKGWTSRVKDGRQVLKNFSEKVEIDFANQSFTLHSEVAAHSSYQEDSYILTTGVQYKDGKLHQL